jgi:hypothetical protein
MKPFAPPKPSLLSGLGSNRDVAAYGKSRAFGAAAEMGMDRAQKQQEMGVSQMQEDSQQRQRQAQNYTSRAGNEAQERVGQSNLDTRRSVFNIGMGFDYGALQRRRQLNLQQALLNSAAKDF